MGDEGIQQLACRARHLIDRPVEGRFIAFGRSGESTQLPNELERGCTDFFIGGGWLEIMQSFDVSTHVLPRCTPHRLLSGPVIEIAEVKFCASTKGHAADHAQGCQPSGRRTLKRARRSFGPQL
jgi:hypothetical protein